MKTEFILATVVLICQVYSSVYKLKLCDVCSHRSNQISFNSTPVENNAISCVITDKICEFDKTSKNFTPEHPRKLKYFKFNNHYVFLKNSSKKGSLERNITFGAPYNHYIMYVNGFTLQFDRNSSINICLNNKLNFQKNKGLVFQFDCFSKYNEHSIIPDNFLKVDIRTIYNGYLSKPIQLNLDTVQNVTKTYRVKKVGINISTVSLIGITLVALSVAFAIYCKSTNLMTKCGMLSITKFTEKSCHYSKKTMLYNYKSKIQNNITNKESFFAHVLSSKTVQVLLFVAENEHEHIKDLIMLFCSVLREYGVDACCNITSQKFMLNRSLFVENIIENDDLKVLLFWTPKCKEACLDFNSTITLLLERVKVDIISSKNINKYAFIVFDHFNSDSTIPKSFQQKTKMFSLPSSFNNIYFWLIDIEQFTADRHINFEKLSFNSSSSGKAFLKQMTILSSDYMLKSSVRSYDYQLSVDK